MGRNDRAIKKIDPSFLLTAIADDKSLVGMDPYVLIPSLKIIQGLSDAPLKKQFGEGAVIIRPGDKRVWVENENPYLFVALLFFVEYAKWSDINDASQQMILERNFNPDSEIARRSRESKLRKEKYGPDGKFEYRYIEHLRFPGIIYSEGELNKFPVTLSFEKGEFMKGRNFISACTLRREVVDGTPRQVPLWAQVWFMSASLRNRGSYSWYGHDFEPAGLIDPADAEYLKGEHLKLVEAHAVGRVQVEDEMTGIDQTVDVSKEAGF